MEKSKISKSISSIATHITHILNCLTTLESDHRPKSALICDQEKLLIQTSTSLILQNINNLSSASINLQDSALVTADISDIDHRRQTLDECINQGTAFLKIVQSESEDLLKDIHEVLYL